MPDAAVTDPVVTDPAVASFVRRSTLKSTLWRDPGALDHVMATAYQLFQAGRYAEVDVLCRGLIAADRTYWWSYSLRAAALRRLGRLEEALVEVDHGLVFEPDEKKLLFMRGELLSAIGEWRERAPGSPPTAPPRLSP
jgi:Flp pilus assembly protein TadD